MTIPAGACYFRKTIQTERPEQAEVQITADDAYELFVNGRRAGDGKNWRVMQSHDITKLFVAGPQYDRRQGHQRRAAFGRVWRRACW